MISKEIICDNCGYKQYILIDSTDDVGCYQCKCGYKGIWGNPPASCAVGLDNYKPKKNLFYTNDNWRS